MLGMVLVGADAGGDRGRAHRRHRRERGDAVVDVDALAPDHAPSAGARPVAIARSSIAGFSASITHRTSFFGVGCSRRSCSHRRIRRPAYFSSVAPRGRRQQPQQQRSATIADRRSSTTTARRAATRARLGVERQRVARAWPVEPRAHARSSGRVARDRDGRAERRRRAAPATTRRRRRPASRRTAARRRRARAAPQRPPPPVRARARSGASRRSAISTQASRSDHDREQEPGGSAGKRSPCREVDLEVAGARARPARARAGTAACPPPRRRRCPGRCRRRDAPCCTVTRRDDRRERSVSGAGRAPAAAVQAPAVDDARHRALRGAVRRAHAGHEVLGDARPDGADRAPRRDLAGRRPARHVDVPARAPTRR